MILEVINVSPFVFNNSGKKKLCIRLIKCDCVVFIFLKICPLNKESALKMKQHINTALDLKNHIIQPFF